MDYTAESRLPALQVQLPYVAAPCHWCYANGFLILQVMRDGRTCIRGRCDDVMYGTLREGNLNIMAVESHL